MIENIINAENELPSRRAEKIAIKPQQNPGEKYGNEIKLKNFGDTNDSTYEMAQGQDFTDVITRILVIDDEDQILGLFKRILESAGYGVMLARDGEEGLKLLSETLANIVITDFIMPNKGGIETIAEIRQNFPDVKIVGMSGGGWYGTEIEFDMAEKFGARTLKKPIGRKELLTTIEELLN